MNDLQDFQGLWEAVWLAEDGRKRDPDEVKSTRLMIAGDRYTLYLGGYEWHGVITRINTARNCGAIDFLSAGGPRGEGTSFLGLYILEDDELTVCVAPPGKERPKGFDSKRGSGHWLYLLKRHAPARARPVEQVAAAV
jgi:uncharacterized protein (TIGR03067 family)